VIVLYLFAAKGAPGKDEVFLVVVLFAAPVSSLVAARKSGAAEL